MLGGGGSSLGLEALIDALTMAHTSIILAGFFT